MHGACPVCNKATAPEEPQILDLTDAPHVPPIEEAPVVEQRPPVAPPPVETLSVLYHKAVAEVERLKDMIHNCIHDWDESEPVMGSCKMDMGELHGTQMVWILRQTRDCQICGVQEVRVKFAPEDNWAGWKVVVDKPETPSETGETE